MLECMGREKARKFMDSVEISPVNAADTMADYLMAHMECGCRFCAFTKRLWESAAAAQGITCREYVKRNFAMAEFRLKGGF